VISGKACPAQTDDDVVVHALAAGQDGSVAGEADRIFSPIGHADVSAERRDGKILPTLGRLDIHDVIVLENWKS